MTVNSALSQSLSEPILSTHQTYEELQAFLLARIPRFRLPATDTWEAEAEQLRQRVLDEVVFRGVPENWRTGTPDVVWGDVIKTRKRYVIRKLRYQALPGLWIPALLYEPTQLRGRVPVVLNVNGHVGPPGKAISYKQIRCVNLAKQGILALNPEWLNFGELQGIGYQHNRASYLDLCGVAGVAVFFLAMQRGLDVLLTHEHADSERAAVTGLSGGGWQTILLSALDTRVRLAVPVAGYIGLDVRVKHREDIGDIEQNPADLVTIADYPVLTAMLAPRPTLLIYNQIDDCCFQTERARPSVYEPVQPLYEALGKADAFQFHNNTDPGTHNYELDNRQQFYRFFSRHFLPSGARIDDEVPSDDEVRTEAELTVGLPPDNADFITLATDLARTLPRNRWPLGDHHTVRAWQQTGRERLRELLRYEPLDATASLAGEQSDGGRRVVRCTLRLGDTWTLPAVELRETAAPRGLVLVTADGGRATAAPIVADALKRGMRVIVVDLVLNGECRTQATPIHQFAMVASAAGLRLLGVQTAQLVAAGRWAARHAGVDGVTVVGIGRVSSVVALAAGAVDETLIQRVVTVEAPVSLKLLIEDRVPYEECPSLYCFGLLEAFDIRELIGLIAPRPVEMIRPAGAPARIDAELMLLRELYARFGVLGFQPNRQAWSIGSWESRKESDT